MIYQILQWKMIKLWTLKKDIILNYKLVYDILKDLILLFICVVNKLVVKKIKYYFINI